MKHKKTKLLSAGDLRRLSIAEEIVHGPSLLLIDEPTTDLDIKDISTMLMTFREMVNQDKTVVASIHKVSLQFSGFSLFVFKHLCFCSLLLLLLKCLIQLCC